MFHQKPDDKKNRERDVRNKKIISLFAKLTGNEKWLKAQEEAEKSSNLEQAQEEELENSLNNEKQKKDAASIKNKIEEKKRKRGLLNLFYDLLRQPKRILSTDRDKAISGKARTQEQKRKEEREKIIDEQQKQRQQELERIRGKEKGASLDRKQQKEVEEKIFRPVMHAKRAPGLQAGEKAAIEQKPAEQRSGGLKHDFSGRPATAGLAKVIEEISEQHLGRLKPGEGKNSGQTLSDILNHKGQGNGGPGL